MAFKTERSRTKKVKNQIRSTMFRILLLVLCVVIIFGCFGSLFYYLNKQSEDLGNERIQKISDQMQATLNNSKIMLLQLASDVEVLNERGTKHKALQAYLSSQSRIFRDKSDNTLMNAFICTSEWVLISDSELPENYVVTEREWYAATIRNGIDNIYISAPYVDAFTGRMCFTATLLLSDGKTIVGIDFNLSNIQKYVAEMNQSEKGEALIVSRDGIVVGYTDNSLAGEKIADVLPEYMGVYEKLLNEYNDSKVIEANISGKDSKIFCNRSGEWLLLYKADGTAVSGRNYRWFWICFILIILLVGGLFTIFLLTDAKRKKAKEALENREYFIDELCVQARELLSRIKNADGAGQKDDNGSADTVMKQISASTEALYKRLDDASSRGNVQQEKKPGKKRTRKKGEMITLTKSFRNGIMAIMTITIVVAILFTGLVLVNWGNDRIEHEVDSYNYQLENWTNTQLQTMNMFVDTIAANPSVLDDYDFAVEYLDRIVRNYPQISAAYIARPGNAHEMTMNNGWVPNADYIVAERQWYVDTVNSPTEMNISTPYLDARTGLYCVTFSRVVYSSENGEQIGVFALDFYIENLTSIMESSYSGQGYAFLVDNSNVIVNHPNREYQISGEKNTNVKDTEYESLLDNSAVHFIWDYDGKLKVCLSRTESLTGFTVISVKDASAVYGIVLLSGFVFILLLVICVVLLYKLIIKLIRWQDGVRKTLTEAAESAEAASRTKDDFLANMSHEIRTPMNAVVGMTELILRENDISSTVRDYCYQIKNSGKNLLSIINDILDFSKIESGKMELVEDTFNIASALNDISNMAFVRIGEKPLKFIAMVDPAIPSGLVGDELRLRQIIINIVVNAIKYSREGCVFMNVYLSRDEDGVPLRPGENEVELVVEVIDTGIGIAEEDMPKLFDSFQKLDTKKNRSIEGTGLGLPITKRLIEQMGGGLTVSSTYGKGSDFSFKIPIRVADSTPFVQVKNTENIHAAIYADLDKFIREETGKYMRQNFEWLSKALDIDLECYYSLDAFKRRMGEKTFTHIITGVEEYCENEAFFKEVPELIIVQKREEIIPGTAEIKRVYEPFNALSLAAALNGENFVDYSGDNEFVVEFTAPEARILIVDDNDLNLQVAQGLMQPYQMQTETALSGSEAIRLLQENKNYDIVFMDHMMPEMDGVEATKRIRELPGEYFKNVSIVALTANALLGARDMFIQAGMNGFLAKPIELKNLNSILRNFLPKSYIRENSASNKDSASVSARVTGGNDEFNPRTGLFYSGGDTDMYNSILRNYLSKGGEKLDIIRGLYEQKDWHNYVIEVHALKSTSLTIGAKTLSELAKELEFAGRDGDIEKITEKTEELLSHYEKILGIVEKYLLENTEAEEKPLSADELTEASPEQVKEWIEKIITACDDMNAGEVKNICTEAAGYSYDGRKLGDLFDGVLSAAEEFEFDEAAEKVKNITI